MVGHRGFSDVQAFGNLLVFPTFTDQLDYFSFSESEAVDLRFLRINLGGRNWICMTLAS